MSRSGFTLIELVVTLTLIGIVLGIAFPRTRDLITQETVRGARRGVTTQLARARAVAAQRGCTAVLNINRSTSQMWITACRVSGPGIDTVGTVDNPRNRYGITFTSDGDSIRVTPQGLALGSGWITMTFAKGNFTEKLAISPVGRATW